MSRWPIFGAATRAWWQLLALTAVSGLFPLWISFISDRYMHGTKAGNWPDLSLMLGYVCAATVFIFCFNDSRLRRAALVGVGISALLTGPSLAFDFIDIAALGRLPFELPALATLVSLLSAGAIWHWQTEKEHTDKVVLREQFKDGFLVLLLVFLLTPSPNFSESLGIRDLIELPPAAVAADPGERIKATQEAMSSTVNKSMEEIMKHGFGIFVLFAVVGLASEASRWSLQDQKSGSPGLFPASPDLALLALFLSGGIFFSFSSDALANMIRNHPQPLDQDRMNGIIMTIAFLPGLAFLWSSLTLTRRLYRAPSINAAVGFLFLLISLGLVGLALRYALPSLRWISYSVLGLFVLQAIFLFSKKKFSLTPVFENNAGESVLQFALWGGISLATVSTAFFAIAIRMAYVSVVHINYLLDWGAALEKGTRVPSEKIAPLFASMVFQVTFLTGPVFFFLCLFLSSIAAFVLSAAYVLAQWGMKWIVRDRAHKPLVITPANPGSR